MSQFRPKLMDPNVNEVPDAWLDVEERTEETDRLYRTEVTLMNVTEPTFLTEGVIPVLSGNKMVGGVTEIYELVPGVWMAKIAIEFSTPERFDLEGEDFSMMARANVDNNIIKSIELIRK